MIFSSFDFIFIFLPLILLLIGFLQKLGLHKLSWIVIAISSLIFYGYWDLKYLLLIIVSVAFNHFFGNLILRTGQNGYRLVLLTVVIISNLVVLGYFKYTHFILDNFNNLFGSAFVVSQIALPLAISFYTIQQIAFCVDCYQGTVQKVRFPEYLVFVTFFPQLIAGPIVHHRTMLPQYKILLREGVAFSSLANGIFVFCIGLAKKVLVADQLAPHVHDVFESQAAFSVLDAWFGSLAYTFQLYFDFSGYADMAVGLGLMFGIKIIHNFNSPFLAHNMVEFWKRWHISLTNFFNSYLFYPLMRKMSDKGIIGLVLAVNLVFLVSGVWHGANWTYIIFGVLNGIGVSCVYTAKHFKLIKLPKYFSIFLTFIYVNVTFVFFRAENPEIAVRILKAMIGFGQGSIENSVINLQGCLLIFIALLVCFQQKNVRNFRFKGNIIELLVAGICFIFSIILLEQPSDFIYFQF